MKPRVSYLICATPRCGGYLLFEALENTGLAGIPGEYFWDDKEWAKKFGATDYADFLTKVIENSTTPNGVFGTKLMWDILKTLSAKCGKHHHLLGATCLPMQSYQNYFLI